MQFPRFAPLPPSPGFTPAHAAPRYDADLQRAHDVAAPAMQSLTELEDVLRAAPDGRDPGLVARTQRTVTAARDAVLGLVHIEPLRESAERTAADLERVSGFIDKWATVDGLEASLRRAAHDATILEWNVRQEHFERYNRHVADFAGSQLSRFDHDRNGSIDVATEAIAVEHEQVYAPNPWMRHEYDAAALLRAADMTSGTADGRVDRNELIALASRADRNGDQWLTIADLLDAETAIQVRSRPGK
jgi:hypothetical protein